MLVGAISGLLSFYAEPISYYLSGSLSGAIFGLLIGLYFVLFFKKPLLAVFLFIVFSAASSYVGYMFLQYIGGYPDNPSYLTQVLIIMMVGSINCLFLLIAFRNTINRLNAFQFIVLFILGILASLSYNFRFTHFGGEGGTFFNYQDRILPFFLIWQTCMAGGLGWAISKGAKNNIKLHRITYVTALILGVIMIMTTWSNILLAYSFTHYSSAY